MCIRDRDKYDVVSYKIIPDEREQIADELVRLCDDVKCNLVPVSYTHLDVYKRQALAHSVPRLAQQSEPAT